MSKVHAGEVASGDASTEAPALPERVQAALGELVGAAKEGLLALSVGVGLGVMHELMAEEVEGVCGPRGKHDPERVAYRHGSGDGEVTLGARRVAVSRPRMRAKDGGGEMPVESYEHFASRDALSAVVLERMLAVSLPAGFSAPRSPSENRWRPRRVRLRSRLSRARSWHGPLRRSRR